MMLPAKKVFQLGRYYIMQENTINRLMSDKEIRHYLSTCTDPFLSSLPPSPVELNTKKFDFDSSSSSSSNTSTGQSSHLLDRKLRK